MRDEAQRWRLSREDCAAFGATVTDNTATAFGGHAGAEAVVTLATDD